MFYVSQVNCLISGTVISTIYQFTESATHTTLALNINNTRGG